MKTFSWPTLNMSALGVILTMTLLVLWTACTDQADDSLSGAGTNAGARKGGGNVECSAGQYSTGRINYNATTGEWTADLTGALIDFGTLGFKVIVSDDGRSFSWYADPGICVRQVIVKGATAATVTSYDGTVSSATGLTAPAIKGDRTPQISNVTICYDKCGEVCYNYQTAFGGDTGGAGAAWWFFFDPTQGATQTIYAGQNATDGTVTLENGAFTIDLGSWSLQLVKDAVKIGGYTILPSNRPAAGNYEKSGGTTLYKGDAAASYPVGDYPYYVIHLDVKQVVVCPQ